MKKFNKLRDRFLELQSIKNSRCLTNKEIYELIKITIQIKNIYESTNIKYTQIGNYEKV